MSKWSTDFVLFKEFVEEHNTYPQPEDASLLGQYLYKWYMQQMFAHSCGNLMVE